MFVQITRRAALGALAAPLFSAAPKPIRLGGPIFLKSDDPEELAREHRRLGYSAAYCPRCSHEDETRAKAIEKAFAGQNVVIAEVGAWVNLLDPDTEKRKKNLQYVTERTVLADLVGSRCCVDIAGSLNPKIWYGPHPQNLGKEAFDATVENCRKIIDAAKPKRTKFTIEMQMGLLPEGPDRYVELIKAVDRKEFGVHMDVCNTIVSPMLYYRNAEYIKEMFSKLGKWIASCHAKDLEWKDQYSIRFDETIPGRGGVDYRTYLTELSKLPVDAPLMLEHLKLAEEYEEGKKHILKVGADLGLKFA